MYEYYYWIIIHVGHNHDYILMFSKDIYVITSRSLPMVASHTKIETHNLVQQFRLKYGPNFPNNDIKLCGTYKTNNSKNSKSLNIVFTMKISTTQIILSLNHMHKVFPISKRFIKKKLNYKGRDATYDFGMYDEKALFCWKHHNYQ